MKALAGIANSSEAYSPLPSSLVAGRIQPFLVVGQKSSVSCDCQLGAVLRSSRPPAIPPQYDNSLSKVSRGETVMILLRGSPILCSQRKDYATIFPGPIQGKEIKECVQTRGWESLGPPQKYTCHGVLMLAEAS